MKTLILLLLLLAPAATAQTVSVKSGAHDGFTRLVLELGRPVDWQLGRTADGYALRLEPPGARFDLSQVYQLIGRERLAAIWVEPDTNQLKLGIGCACHAIPFEFRPGVIVIDLRDGRPPQGSSFELALEGEAPPPLEVRVLPRPRARPSSLATYDWRTADQVPHSTGLPLAINDPALTQLRNTLLLQLSRGAAQGVVQIAEEIPEPQQRPGPLAQVRIVEYPGLFAGTGGESSPALTGSGAACLPDSALDMAAWGSDQPVSAQIALSATGLIGEFDRPDPEAIRRAVRYYLSLGFGAEALHLLRSFDMPDEERQLWQAMAGIVDHGAAEGGAFAGMMVCDTAAALWAVLAQARSDGTEPNTQAVLRSFSALPRHLRQHLGPLLADRFLGRNDTESARAVRDAVLRTSADLMPSVRLMEARIDLAQGKTDAAGSTLADLVTEAGPVGAEAMIAWVDRLLAEGKPVDAPTVTALAALLHEHKGGPLEPALHKAHVLSLAAAGDFDAAFAAQPTVPGAEPALWQRLAEQGPDTALLTHAVLPTGAAPLSDMATSRQIAARLLKLGFADQAMAWMQPADERLAETPDDLRVLMAQAELQRRDSRAALRLLAGLTGADAGALRAAAQARLGDAPAAQKIFAANGNAEAALGTARVARDWRFVAAAGPKLWQDAAALVLSTGPTAAEHLGPLASADAAVAESAGARVVIQALLAPGAEKQPANP